MYIFSRYGTSGFSSWEFPQLNMGLPGVNDSDGESYPFYGGDNEMVQLVGPITSTYICSRHSMTKNVYRRTDHRIINKTNTIGQRCGIHEFPRQFYYVYGFMFMQRLIAREGHHIPNILLFRRRFSRTDRYLQHLFSCVRSVSE